MTTIRNPHLPYDETRWRPSNPATCARKVRYATAEAAYADRDLMISRLDVYWCDCCEGWHVGRNEQLPVERQGTPAPIAPPSPVVVMRMDSASMAGMERKLLHYKDAVRSLHDTCSRKDASMRNLQDGFERKCAEVEALNGIVKSQKKKITELEKQLREASR